MANGTLATDIKTFACRFTGVNVNYKKTTIWYDGTPMDDSKCDGTIYRKLVLGANTEYYVDTDYLDGKPLNPNRFGMKGDGIFDNSTIMEEILASPIFPSVAMNFDANTNYYFSRKISPRKQIYFTGKSGKRGGLKTTTFSFPKGCDGIVFNRHNTNGSHLQVSSLAGFPSADSSVVSNIRIIQNNAGGSFTFYDFNPDINRAIGLTWHGIFQTNKTIKVIDNAVIDTDGYQKVIGTATFLSMSSSKSRIVLIDRPSSDFAIGDSVTWTSGAGTISYIFKNQNAVCIQSSNSIAVNQIITKADSTTFQVLQIVERIVDIVNLSDVSSNFPTSGVMVESDAGGDGIKMISRANVLNCTIEGFGYNGVYVVSTFNNTNVFRIENTGIYSSRNNGIFVSGGDSNAGFVTGVDITHSGAHSLYDQSFLGNHYHGMHTSVFGLGAYKIIGYNNFSTLISCYTEGQPSTMPIYNSYCEAWSKVRVIGGDYGATFPIRDNRNDMLGHISEGLFEVRGLHFKCELENSGKPRYGEGSVFSDGGNDDSPSITLTKDLRTDPYEPSIAFAQASHISNNKFELIQARIQGGQNGLSFFNAQPLGFNISNFISYEAIDTTKAMYSSRFALIVVGGAITKVVVLNAGKNQKSINFNFTGVLAGMELIPIMYNGQCLGVTVKSFPTNNTGFPDTKPTKRVVSDWQSFYPFTDNSFSLGLPTKQFKEVRTKAIYLDNAVFKKADASADSATAVGATYSQTEVQAILTELRDLKAKMRTAGLLDF